MAVHDFVFSLQISDEPSFAAMLGELGASVLQHLGFAPGAIAEFQAGLRAALDRGTAEGTRRCDVAFRVAAGELVVAVCYEGGAEWRTARPLPVR